MREQIGFYKTAIPNVELTGVYFINPNLGYISGFSGTILFTSNGGNLWTTQNSTTNNDLRAIYFINANTGYSIGTAGVILKTTNGGNIWQPQISGTTNNLYSIYFINENTGTAVGTGIILRTTNAGNNWIDQPSGVSTDLYSVQFPAADTGYTVGQAGKILKTINGGVNISNISTIVPSKFILHQNYPNPFNPNTIINYIISVKNKELQPLVLLKVYDILGNEVITLVNKKQTTGSYSVIFNGANFSSGIYFYKLEVNGFTETKKMILLE